MRCCGQQRGGKSIKIWDDTSKYEGSGRGEKHRFSMGHKLGGKNNRQSDKKRKRARAQRNSSVRPKAHGFGSTVKDEGGKRRGIHEPIEQKKHAVLGKGRVEEDSGVVDPERKRRVFQ